ncbi:MAG: hypothetical protein ACE5FT_01405 [Candidatus Nanoarchaeia archaeon]
MKRNFAWILTLLVLASVFAGLATAAPLPLTIDRVEIDDVDINPNGVNKLDLERGYTYDVEVKLTALSDLDDIEVEVFVSGFEYGGLVDTTTTFDMDSGDSHVKRLEISFPDDVEEDDYKLRVLVSNRNHGEIIQNYNLKIDVPRHGLKIEDVYFQPSGPVQGGEGVLATVRLENKGERQQDDVRVTIDIPTLGVNGIDYIDEIDNNHNEERGTEEIFLKIPRCAAPGVHPVVVKAEFDELTQAVTSTKQIVVEANEHCKEGKSDLQAQLLQLLSAEQANQANVAPVEDVEETSTARKAFQITLLVLLVLLVIVALVFVFTRTNEEF